MMQVQRPGGFTLIELIIALTVGSILMAIAIPNFSSFVRNNRLITETNTLVGHINTARSEAIKRNRSIVLCRSEDPAAEEPECGGADKTWTSGWLMYVNETGGLAYDADGAAPDDVLLKRGVPGGKNINLKSNGEFNSYLVLKPNGTLDEAAVASMVICYETDVSTGRRIDVALSGRVSLTKGTLASPLATCTP